MENKKSNNEKSMYIENTTIFNSETHKSNKNIYEIVLMKCRSVYFDNSIATKLKGI